MNDFLYYAKKNTKFKMGFFTLIFFTLVALIGPLFAEFGPRETLEVRNAVPSAEYFLGTTGAKEDIFSQFVNGIGTALLIGLMAGTLSTAIGLFIGFIAGYKGGKIDEGLMMITNIVMVLPAFALFIIFAAYVPFKGVAVQSLVLGIIQWPWIARSVRSQTLTLRQREFVNLSRITGVKSIRIIIEDIAPNMFSFVVTIFIILFASSIQYAVALDFIGLGPTEGISLGLMLQESTENNSIQYGFWWWFIPPGITITLLSSAMYFMNTGLDEIFNPQLREL